MSFIILILCLFTFQVDASWLNRTIRVDLSTNLTAFDLQNGLLEQSMRTLNGVNATNGQYPWSILTTAWSNQAPGIWSGITCSSTIISENFALTDFHCTAQTLQPPASVIKGYVGEVQWTSPLPAEKFVRHFWYIEPLFENRPSIVLLRFDESLSFNPSIQPIRLPSLVNFAYEAWASYMLGFDTPPGFFSAQLQSVNANIRNNSVCDFVSNFADYEMCAIEVGPGYEDGEIISYNAFTGGAWLVYEYTRGFEFIPVLVGIHQYQYANQTAAFGRATRVSHFVDWVEELTADV